MRRTARLVTGLLLALALLGASGASALRAEGRPENMYRTSLAQWDASDAGFRGWRLNGVAQAADGRLVLDPGHAWLGLDPFPAKGYHERQFYAGGAYLVGEAVSPEVDLDFPAQQAVPSWDASTPPGTWIEIRLRARIEERWTKWYDLGVWASTTDTVERHSVSGQADADGDVAVDTLILSSDHPGAGALQVMARLFALPGGDVPALRAVAVAVSSDPAGRGETPAGDPETWGRILDVPECSQMVYPDSGTVWCSPTSTSMVLEYWLREGGRCETRVRAAKDGVYDWLYDGHGNWPFNTAYAATHGLRAYVARFTSLADAEPWIAAGVPVIINYAWKQGELDNAPLPWSNGHVAVLVGFDADGNPVVNDPAGASDSEVQRVYPRAQLEMLWLNHGGGTAYLIYPPGTRVP